MKNIALSLISALLVLASAGCANVARQGMMNEPRLAAANNSRAQQQVKLAEAAYVGGVWSDAERQYRRLAELMPEAPYPWFKLGNIYVKTEKFDQASAAYHEALKRDASHAKALHNLALANLMLAKRILETGVQKLKSDESSTQASRDLLGELERIIAVAGGAPRSDPQGDGVPSSTGGLEAARSKRFENATGGEYVATATRAQTGQSNTAPQRMLSSENYTDNNQYFEVRSRALLVRTAPISSSKVVHKLQQSERVQLATDSVRRKYWTKVVVANSGVSGWVLANHLAMVSAN